MMLALESPDCRGSGNALHHRCDSWQTKSSFACRIGGQGRAMLRSQIQRLRPGIFPAHWKSPYRRHTHMARCSNPSLPADLKARLETDGYAIIESFASPEEIAALRKRAGELVDELHPEDVTIFTSKNQKNTNDYFDKSAGNISLFFEENAFDSEGNLTQDKALSINKLGHAMHDLDPTFRKFSRSPKVKAVFDALAYQQPTPVQSMYIFKQPRIGGECIPHQDSTFLYTEPPSVIGMWLALEKATMQNGCLYILPKSHNQGVHQRFARQSDGNMSFTGAKKEHDSNEFIPVEVGEGTLVLLHGAVVHSSTENTSEKSRHAYTVHFIDAKHPWSEDNWLQRPKDFPFENL